MSFSQKNRGSHTECLDKISHNERLLVDRGEKGPARQHPKDRAGSARGVKEIPSREKRLQVQKVENEEFERGKVSTTSLGSVDEILSLSSFVCLFV